MRKKTEKSPVEWSKVQDKEVRQKPQAEKGPVWKENLWSNRLIKLGRMRKKTKYQANDLDSVNTVLQLKHNSSNT